MESPVMDKKYVFKSISQTIAAKPLRYIILPKAYKFPLEMTAFDEITFVILSVITTIYIAVYLFIYLSESLCVDLQGYDILFHQNLYVF